MESVNRGSGLWSPMMLVLAFAMVVMVTQVSATRWTVGGRMGWTTNVNYTTWAKGKHFYNGDWLFFVYDRNQMNVLEVNSTDYESCNSDHPLQNWTRGAGRDVVPLNVTRDYYIISGKGFCYGGMKVAIHVANPPPPPTSAPLNQTSASPPISTLKGTYVLPAALAIGTLWDALVWLW
uniref:Lamin-like protein n=1 Tax=Rhizophora mucronata TaxID=61149 RepID=A0A2P2P2C7_RHIMU